MEHNEITDRVVIGKYFKVKENKIIIACDSQHRLVNYIFSNQMLRQDGFSYFELDNVHLKKLQSASARDLLKCFTYKNGRLSLSKTALFFLKFNQIKNNIRYNSIRYIKELTFSLILNSFIQYILTSIICALISTYVTIQFLTFEKEKIFTASFLDFFIPILAVVLTLTGVYTNLVNEKKSYLKQRSDSVKPDVSLKNLDRDAKKTSGHQKDLHVDTNPIIGRGVGFTQTLVCSIFSISNFGLNTARNLRFITTEEFGQFVTHSQPNFKALKVDSEDDFSIWVPNTPSTKPFTVYSVCENIYGEPVFHAHTFISHCNGYNVYHIRDRFIPMQTREYKRLKRCIFV